MCSSSKSGGGFRLLKTQFEGRGEVKGYLFTQIRKTNRAFLYEVSLGSSKYYEVFIKKENSRYGCISYPTSNGFGIWAWTYILLDEAIKKFHEINNNFLSLTKNQLKTN